VAILIKAPVDQQVRATPFFEDEGEDPKMQHWMSLTERNIKIFKITKNASRDDSSSSQYGGRSSYKRHRAGDEDYWDYDSDYSEFEAIPSKVMYGTINTLYKDYIKLVDCEKQTEFQDLTQKYLSRPIFIVDKTEHKKIMKERKRIAKKNK